MNTVTQHELAVRQTVQRLQKMGVVVGRNIKDADLVADGKSVKVKTSAGARKNRFGDSFSWLFYLGKEKRADVYVLYIPPNKRLGFGVGLWLVVPGSELKAQTIYVSVRSLVSRWAPQVDRWDLIRRNGKAAK